LQLAALWRHAAAALLIGAAGAAFGQPAAPAAAPVEVVQEVRVVLETALGRVVLALDPVHAPATTANFLRYVDQKRLDGTSFYRALQLGGPQLGLIQGGVGKDAKRLLPPVRHEPTTMTGLSHGNGAVSMARLAPGSAAGDFFITVGAIPSLDARPENPGDNLGFAVFGRVAEGMDVVQRILTAPVSGAGEGAMKGQMLAEPVRIISARRVENPG
jgi:peptidyl-prolyl cis-trans isomerase A (cyclophilin A)